METESNTAPEAAAQRTDPPREGLSSVPYAGKPHVKLNFGRHDADGTIMPMPVNIEGTKILAAATYQFMSSLSIAEPPLTEDQFVRMWRTVVLKRAQDVYEATSGVRPDGFIRFGTTLTIPRPLADFVAAIGRYTSIQLDVHFDPSPPVKTSPPQDWYTVDTTIYHNWQIWMIRMKNLYQCVDFPRRSQVIGLPYAIMSFEYDKRDLNGVITITHEATSSDALLFFVCGVHPYAHLGMPKTYMHTVMTKKSSIHFTRGEYLMSYSLSVD